MSTYEESRCWDVLSVTSLSCQIESLLQHQRGWYEYHWTLRMLRCTETFCTYFLDSEHVHSMRIDATSTTESSRCWDELQSYIFLHASKHMPIAENEGISKNDFCCRWEKRLWEMLSHRLETIRLVCHDVRAEVTLMMLKIVFIVQMFRRPKHLFYLAILV